MTLTIIIIISSLLIIAYLFDLSSSKTKVPTVILLLLIGWAIRQISILLNINLPDLSFLLPLLGTIGLILIVLEGSLELELEKSKKKVITQAFLMALIPIVLISVILGLLFSNFGNYSFRTGLINALPLSIISSAIAIPSAINLSRTTKEFIIYETSMSDIIGVLIFNFIIMHEVINFGTFFKFSLDLAIILIISTVSTIALSYILHKIDHHVKFLPIILTVILIYSLSKLIHLPALIFILIFGIFIGNFEKVKNMRWKKFLDPDLLHTETHKFKDLVLEISFLVRTLFFLLFGFFIDTNELLNINAFFWTIGIVIIIFSIRFILLKIFKIDIKPNMYIAPRGLITILLFLTIPASDSLHFVNNSLIIQIIIATVLIMTFGIMKQKRTTDKG